MSETTKLVRQVTAEVLVEYCDEFDRSFAQSLGNKIAADPRLDRLEISSESIEPVANIVASSVYRIDLDGFDISHPDQVRRKIVEEVTYRFCVRTGAKINQENGGLEGTNLNNHSSDSQQRDSRSDGDIIVADSSDYDVMHTAFDDGDTSEENNNRPDRTALADEV